jgi:hypothetical protein
MEIGNRQILYICRFHTFGGFRLAVCCITSFLVNATTIFKSKKDEVLNFFEVILHFEAIDMLHNIFFSVTFLLFKISAVVGAERVEISI